MTPAARSLVMRWAANGALAGAGSAGILMWIDRLQFHDLQNPTFFVLPGLAFGLVVALPLWRRGLAGGWPCAIFIAASIIAWPAGYHTGGGLMLAIEAKGLLRLAPAGFAGGLVWAAISTAAALNFPFMRTGRIRPVLVIAGGLTGALCVSLLEFLGQWGFGPVYIVLWGVWYAVQGGLIAMALPDTDC
ncbi:MAG: hypothetical protein IMF08_16120 [Proteobacteria bacterium]|nr:hypothetical protein [Pseudomonadota bacterium]